MLSEFSAMNLRLQINLPSRLHSKSFQGEDHFVLPTMLRPTLPRIGHSLRTFRRSLHNVPPLTHDFRESGIPEFLSPAGFDMAWTQYQSLMVEKLNVLTAGMLTSIEDFGSSRIVTATLSYYGLRSVDTDATQQYCTLLLTALQEENMNSKPPKTFF
jgi:hypothetical protein